MSDSQNTAEIGERKLDQIISKVRELAASRPDHEYVSLNDAWPEQRDYNTVLDLNFYGVETARALNGCLYLHKRNDSDEVTAGCIFGHAFLELGYPVEEIVKCDRSMDAQLAIRHLVPELEAADPDNEESSVFEKLLWCNEVQSSQDTNFEWGECIEHGDQRVDHHREEVAFRAQQEQGAGE